MAQVTHKELLDAGVHLYLKRNESQDAFLYLHGEERHPHY
jgi:hypothetical protein